MEKRETLLSDEGERDLGERSSAAIYSVVRAYRKERVGLGRCDTRGENEK